MKIKLLASILLFCALACTISCSNNACKLDNKELSTMKSALIETDTSIQLVDTLKGCCVKDTIKIN